MNRVHERYFATSDPRRCATAAASSASRRGTSVADRLAAQYANLADLEEVAVRERAELAGLEHRIGDASVAHVPELGHDVHDFAALPRSGATSWGPTSVPAVSTILVAADAKWVRDLVKSACTAPGQRVVEVTRGQDVRDVVGKDAPTS